MQTLIIEIKEILQTARQNAYKAINTEMITAYWEVGKRIVEEEQKGEQRATYGKQLIKTLSHELTTSLGKGFTERSLREYRQFYLLFKDFEIWRTVYAKLTWSHFQRVLRVSDEKARGYYLKEASENQWSIRTLDRNISTLYYERLLLSQTTKVVEQEMLDKTKALQKDKFEFIKNPSVLEFLNLPNNKGYTESELESAIIGHLQHFLLELGKGFAFVAQQQLIRTETTDYFIDLVFYNYILKCFVIIDLKTSRITHQDVGQMDMYVRMYDDLKRQTDHNPTIGIVLCTETDQDIARYSILKDNENLFATKYKLYLPTEEELRAEIEREKMILQMQFGKSDL